MECPESDEEQCLTDDTCEGDMKCCSDGCMLKCTVVEPAIIVEKGEIGDPGDAGEDVIIDWYTKIPVSIKMDNIVVQKFVATLWIRPLYRDSC